MLWAGHVTAHWEGAVTTTLEGTVGVQARVWALPALLTAASPPSLRMTWEAVPIFLVSHSACVVALGPQTCHSNQNEGLCGCSLQ